MKGIKIYLTSPWGLWGDPLLERDYSGVSAVISPSTEKNPNGHNTLLLKGRDHVFSKWPISVYASHTYQFEITAKRVAGGLALGAGFWGGDKEPWNLTPYEQRFNLIKDLGDGWGIYRKTVKIKEDCNKVYLYFQLEQYDGHCQWLVSDIKVIDLTETGGAIVRFLSAVILSLAYAWRKGAA